MRLITRLVRQALVIAATVAATVYVVWAFSARNMADLGPEHRVEFASEFEASQEESTDWHGYLDVEGRLTDELADFVESDGRTGSLVDRHDAKSLVYPGKLDVNWNRSYEMMADAPRGVAILLHGLSDSPYSMRTTATTLLDAGFSVVVPRMPGHGFAVGDLRQARWEDWTAAVRIAVERAKELGGDDSSLVLVGYSNGGLLAIDYALRCEEYEGLPCPDRLVLMSPAIALPKAAIVTNLHSLVSWTPYFEKFQWMSIMPEVDPFKFTSFPKRSAWEVYQVSTRMHKELAQPAEAAKLPPILTFQSVVDNTVSAAAITRNLYRYVPRNGSKLVVYDVNRHNTILSLSKRLPDDPAVYFTAAAPLHYDVAIVRNQHKDTVEVEVAALDAGSTHLTANPSDLQWPDGTYSLSHIAVPFRSDDAVYGNGSAPSSLPLVLGAQAPRGEAGLLRLRSDYFLRARYNPFYAIQEEVLREWLDESSVVP